MAEGTTYCWNCNAAMPLDDGWFWHADQDGINRRYNVKLCSSCFNKGKTISVVPKEEGGYTAEVVNRAEENSQEFKMSFDEYCQKIQEWANKESKSASIKRSEYGIEPQEPAFASMLNTSKKTGDLPLHVWHSWATRHTVPIENILVNSNYDPRGSDLDNLFKRAKDNLGYAFMLVIYCEYLKWMETLPIVRDKMKRNLL